MQVNVIVTKNCFVHDIDTLEMANGILTSRKKLLNPSKAQFKLSWIKMTYWIESSDLLTEETLQLRKTRVALFVTKVYNEEYFSTFSSKHRLVATRRNTLCNLLIEVFSFCLCVYVVTKLKIVPKSHYRNFLN